MSSFPCGDAVGLVSEFSDLKRIEMKSSGARPGTGTRRGLPSSGWPRNKTLTLRAVPATVCFGYGLGCDCEADRGRAYYAALLHRRLQII